MTPEFSRPFAVDRLALSGLEQAVVADAQECRALAARLGVPAVLALSCRFRLTPGAARTVLAEGRLEARVVRECVLTLDEFETAVAEVFRVRFVPEEALLEDDDPDSEDQIALTGGVVDLGEAAAEQLALALDPYPRKPGSPGPEEEPGAAPSAFAALARLRRPGD